MALLNILNFPDPRLRTKAKQVTDFNKKIIKLTDDMLETMYADPGIGLSPKHLISHSVKHCLRHISPAAVFTPTMSGASAKRVAAFRSPVWVVAVSPSERTCQQLQFSYGVVAVHNPVDPETWDDFVRSWLAEHDLSGNYAMLVAGPSQENPDANHRLEIIELG